VEYRRKYKLVAFSLVFFTAGVFNIILSNLLFNGDDDINSLNVQVFDVSYLNIHLYDLVNDDSMEFISDDYLNSDYEGYVYMHTLSSLSCQNCPNDNKVIMEKLYRNNKDIKQIIWFVDDINPFSKNLSRQYSGGESYLLGYDKKYDEIFSIKNSSYHLERNILIFDNKNLQKKLVLPYNIEFSDESVLMTINNMINK